MGPVGTGDWGLGLGLDNILYPFGTYRVLDWNGPRVIYYCFKNMGSISTKCDILKTCKILYFRFRIVCEVLN